MMTRTTLTVLLFVSTAAVAQTRPVTRPAPSPLSSPQAKESDELLKAEGLTRVGTLYLLDADARIAELLRPSRQAKKQLDDYARRRGVIDAQIRKADRSIAQWEGEYRTLNDSLSRASNAIAHNRIVGEINVLVSKSKEAERYKEQRRKELAALVAPRDDYAALVAEVAEKLESASKRYVELASDERVNAALSRLSESGPPKVRLGPTPGFTQTLATVRKQREEAKVAVIKLRMDKGVPEVDVTFNGSVTRSVVVDSGAGIVTLTAEVANRIGLKPGADAPVVKLITADGKTTEARLMTLETIRLGQFTVENVECAIMPASVPADVCLLGGSFLQNFIYRMDLASGQLHLTQISGKPKESGRAGKNAGVVARDDDSAPASRPTTSPAGGRSR